MSRYPGTQFKLYDNSQATAIVPVSNVNINDTVQYLTAFASVKGPEGITLTSGEDFYTRYGTQDNIDFKKYGQPLFQASMNVNTSKMNIIKCCKGVNKTAKGYIWKYLKEEEKKDEEEK